MVKQKINIVWFKRDLRTQDHLPLFHAEKHELEYVCVYIFDPKKISHSDTSLRHQQFVYHSIKDINKQWKIYNRRVHIMHANTVEVFIYLSKIYEIKNIFSSQESGTRLSWDIDKSIHEYCKKNNINWLQFQRDGIIRGLKNRLKWDKSWHQFVNQPIIKNTYTYFKDKLLANPFKLNVQYIQSLENYPESYQKAGEKYAHAYLKSFTKLRGKDYTHFISKPLESRKSCSRISPYLSWGNISVKQAFQHIKNHPNYLKYRRSYNAILSRLKWHCHFIQKFEMECDYETRCINRGYEQISYENRNELLKLGKKDKPAFHW